MLDQLREALGRVRSVLDRLDPASLIGAEPAEAVEMMVAHEKVVVAARSACVARVAAAPAFRRGIHHDTEGWLAAVAGTSVTAARRSVATAVRVAAQPEVTQALRRGVMSQAQAEHVSKAVAAAPGEAARLVSMAGAGVSLKGLREECASTIARASDERERYEQTVRNRELRTWVDAETGAGHGHWSLPAVEHARVVAVLRAETDAIFREARRHGRREPSEAYAADALVALTTKPAYDCAEMDDQHAAEDTVGEGTEVDAATVVAADPQLDLTSALDTAVATAAAARPPRALRSAGRRRRDQLVLTMDIAAWYRGVALTGETCEIAGIGPVPVEIATELADDAMVKLVIRDGTDIRAVAHYRRGVPAPLRTALESRDTTCSVPGCDRVLGLEIDHTAVPYAEGGPHSITNDNKLCKPHHRQKTHDGYRLTGSPGHRHWYGPAGELIAADRTGPDP